MSDYRHHVSFGPYTERRWPVWRAKVRIRRRVSAPGRPEWNYDHILDLGWHWRWGKAFTRAIAYCDSAERISRLAGHIVEQESYEQEDPAA